MTDFAPHSTALGALVGTKFNIQNQPQRTTTINVQASTEVNLLDYEMLVFMSNLTELNDINVERFFNSIDILLEKQKKIQKTKQNHNKKNKNNQKNYNNKNQKIMSIDNNNDANLKRKASNSMKTDIQWEYSSLKR